MNTSSTHNNKESADDGINDIEQAKEDKNNEDNVNDDDADDDDDDNDPDYTNSEEDHNPKLRAIKTVQGNKKEKKKKKRKSNRSKCWKIIFKDCITAIRTWYTFYNYRS